MKVSREGSHICGIPLVGICEPNTNTAAAPTSISNVRRVSKRSQDFIILFLTREDVCGCDRNHGGPVTI